jgi:hypothetical protein
MPATAAEPSQASPAERGHLFGPQSPSFRNLSPEGWLIGLGTLLLYEDIDKNGSWDETRDRVLGIAPQLTIWYL